MNEDDEPVTVDALGLEKRKSSKNTGHLSASLCCKKVRSEHECFLQGLGIPSGQYR